MAITTDDFNKIWASTSPLTPYQFSESQYKEGWNFVGATPPSRQMWDFLQKKNDEKMQYLANNYLPLSGGTVTGDVDITGDLSVSGAIINYVENGKVFAIGKTEAGNVDLGWNWVNSEGAGLGLRSTDHPSNPGEFSLCARDSANSCSLNGKPDGSLTWNGQPLLPVGVVQAYAGTTIPNGWLLCDGSAINRVTYAGLFAVIGTTYGAGNGSTTFNLPNLVDKFVEGSATAGTEKSAGLPNITGMAHALLGPNSRIAWDTKDDTGLTGPFYANGRYGTYASDVTNAGEDLPHNLYFDASRSSAIYGNSNTVQPPALTMRYIIKY